MIKKIRGQVFKFLYQGDKYLCVYCQKTYNKFLHEGIKAPVFKKYQIAGGGYKKNTRCPNCGSVDRARLLNLFFRHRTKAFEKATKILHVSPNFQIARFLASHGSISQTVGALEPENFKEFKAIKLDIQKMELEDASFDMVVCCHIIEHVDDDLKAMEEIYRVLRPGGLAVLQVPFAIDLDKTLDDPSVDTDDKRKRTYGQWDHVRLYGLDYLDKLESVGLKVERDNPFKNKWLPEEDLARHRLDPIEDVIVARKS